MVDNKEVIYFADGLKLANEEFYLDAINKFKMLVDEFHMSNLVDDALFNVGLCYYKMNQYNQAVEVFNQVIINYPDATITELEIGNEFGKTSAKCLLGIINCFIKLGKINDIQPIIEALAKYDNNSYIIENNKIFIHCILLLFMLLFSLFLNLH